MLTPALKSRLDKLQALAQRGIGGEQETAKKSYAAILKSIGMTEEQYEQGQTAPRMVRFTFGDRYGRQLWVQLRGVVSTFKGALFRQVFKDHKTTLAVWMSVTQAEEAEMRYLFPIYRKAWERFVEEAELAFLMKNDLLGNPDDDPDSSTPTEEEIKKWNRINSLSQNVQRVNPRKALKSGPDGSP